MLVVIRIAAPVLHNADIGGYGSRRGGRDDTECVDPNFKTTKIDLATPRARGMPRISRTPDRKGRRECRMLDGTRSLACKIKQSIRVSSPQVHRKQTGIPCAMVLTVTPWSPRCAGLFSHRRWQIALANLTPASGCQASTALPSASVLHVQQHRCVHRTCPTFATLAYAPLLGQDEHCMEVIWGR